MGLSDEVHPSKSKEQNPRGLMKKESLRQNKIEHFHVDDNTNATKEIIVSTTSTLEGHTVKKYIGVQTSFTIIDEDELLRIKFVQDSRRSESEIENYNTDQEESITSQRAYNDYQESFELSICRFSKSIKSQSTKRKSQCPNRP